MLKLIFLGLVAVLNVQAAFVRAPPNPFLSLPACGIEAAQLEGCTTEDAQDCFCKIQSAALVRIKTSCQSDDYTKSVQVFQAACGSFSNTFTPSITRTGGATLSSAECTSASCGVTSSTVSITSLTPTTTSTSVTVTSITSGTSTAPSSAGSASSASAASASQTSAAPNVALRAAAGPWAGSLFLVFGSMYLMT
ncbi:hypothetical protein DL96DRAFT_1596528 [Flagelloscypha sp. PMI_526]|nr:hypothetical protein DL96DRAFT_1596528 [Flagelloscypha sp. PMI_526]